MRHQDGRVTEASRTRSESARLRAYLKIERQGSRVAQERAMLRSRRGTRSSAALQQYLRIDRGIEV